MICFFSLIFVGAVCFGIGYWVNGHPEDTRALGAKFSDAVARLFTGITGR